MGPEQMLMACWAALLHESLRTCKRAIVCRACLSSGQSTVATLHVLWAAKDTTSPRHSIHAADAATAGPHAAWQQMVYASLTDMTDPKSHAPRTAGGKVGVHVAVDVAHVIWDSDARHHRGVPCHAGLDLLHSMALWCPEPLLAGISSD